MTQRGTLTRPRELRGSTSQDGGLADIETLSQQGARTTYGPSLQRGRVPL